MMSSERRAESWKSVNVCILAVREGVGFSEETLEADERTLQSGYRGEMER